MTTGRRGRKLWWLAAPAAAVLATATVVGLALAGLSDLRDVETPNRLDGRPAPIFEVPSLREGDELVSLELSRGRPVVLNFFASWCVPCRQELPALQATSERHADKVAVLGVTYLEPRPEAPASFLMETGARFPAGHDPRDAVAAAYGVRGLPTTFFISDKGRILERHDGPITELQLGKTLARLFDLEP
ncbi:MAG: TlpA family protein disulfide reductase [Acidimicrobiia bacterium]